MKVLSSVLLATLLIASKAGADSDMHKCPVPQLTANQMTRLKSIDNATFSRYRLIVHGVRVAEGPLPAPEILALPSNWREGVLELYIKTGPAINHVGYSFKRTLSDQHRGIRGQRFGQEWIISFPLAAYSTGPLRVIASFGHSKDVGGYEIYGGYTAFAASREQLGGVYSLLPPNKEIRDLRDLFKEFFGSLN